MNRPKCEITDCQEPRFSKGYCQRHVNNLNRRGDPLCDAARRRGAILATCTHVGCSEPHYGKDLCRTHYRRKYELQTVMDCPACERCGKPTPRPDAKFCGVRCQMQWHRRHGCYATDEVKDKQRGWRRAWYRTVKADAERYLVHRAVSNLWAREQYAEMTPAERLARGIKWRRANKEKIRNYARARAQRLRRQTPPWANLQAIDAFYAACPAGHHVDHIIPLKHPQVCGLHVETNLQYLPDAENLRKGNRLPPETFDWVHPSRPQMRHFAPESVSSQS